MDREKLIKQLFVGKVTEIIGTEKTTELLKEATVAIDEMLKSRKTDVSGSLGFDEGYAKGYSDATKEACQEIREHYRPNDR